MTALLHGIWPVTGAQPLLPMEKVESCGCRVDLLLGEVRRPCELHEGQGHLSVVEIPDEEDVQYRVRCLRRGCGWAERHWTDPWAVAAGRAHWRDTREGAR